MLDIVTLFRYITGTLMNCESGGAAWRGEAVFPLCAAPPAGSARIGGQSSIGETLVTDVIGGNPHRGLQKRKPRRDSWTAAKRAAFLAELEASCNARRACAAADVGKDAAYGLRRRDPVFAAAWAAAIEQGCENLRALMLARAMGTADAELIADNPDTADRPAPAPPPMSDEMRLKVLQVCRAAADGRQGRASWRGQRAITRSAEEVFAALSGKLDRVEKRLPRHAAD